MSTKTDWETIALRLCAVVRRNVIGWEQSLTTPMIVALKESWNEESSWDVTDPEYWH